LPHGHVLSGTVGDEGNRAVAGRDRPVSQFWLRDGSAADLYLFLLAWLALWLCPKDELGWCLVCRGDDRRRDDFAPTWQPLQPCGFLHVSVYCSHVRADERMAPIRQRRNKIDRWQRHDRKAFFVVISSSHVGSAI